MKDTNMPCNKKTYRVKHILNQEDRIDMFAVIALLPEVDDCRIYLFNDGSGSNKHILRFPGSDPRTWSQYATSDNLSGKRGVIRIGSRRYRITFDQPRSIVITDMAGDTLDEELLEGVLDCIYAYCDIER